jgi:hypothetical protein
MLSSIVTINITHDLWFWLTIFEFFLLIVSGYILFKRKDNVSDTKNTSLRKAKNNQIDMNDLLDNINRSRELYKELSVFCHPDKFVNTTKYRAAEIFFQEITKNRRNYKELISLKERVKIELDIEIAE